MRPGETSDDHLDQNCLQYLIAGGKRRERTQIFCLISWNLEARFLGHSINLDTTASDEDPMYTPTEIY